MGTTKNNIFTNSQNELAQIAKVLGHPARIAILEHISATNNCICTNLVAEIGLAQATISQHLKELKSIGLIQGSISGKRICYCINKENWQKIQQQITLFFNDVNICATVC
jgi:predicted transcriptional regulator